MRRLDLPDAAQAIVRYKRHAAGYDASARRTMWIRERTIDHLELRPGDRVLDVACGTGLSLARLREAVGPDGEVVGIELSPDMLEIARGRGLYAALTRWDLQKAPLPVAYEDDLVTLRWLPLLPHWPWRFRWSTSLPDWPWCGRCTGAGKACPASTERS